MKKFRTSYSTRSLLHGCERKFQLIKLLKNDKEREESEHLSFGSAYGVGIASYLVHQDQERAIYEAWLAYWPNIETEKKNQTRMIAALQASFSSIDDLLQDYEVVSFNGVPAIELSFKININEKYYEVGYLDAVLRNRFTGKHYTFECKHTGSNRIDLDPMYKNSSQGLGYSIVLDQVTGEELASYGVIYFVAQLGQNYKTTIHILPYEKTLLDRFNWFITLGLDIEYMKMLEKLDIYPMRGGSCLAFNKPCQFYGTCDLYKLDSPAKEVEDTNTYQFEYNIDDLITDHLRRLKNGKEATSK